MDAKAMTHPKNVTSEYLVGMQVVPRRYETPAMGRQMARKRAGIP
jgi:hypothetical protein